MCQSRDPKKENTSSRSQGSLCTGREGVEIQLFRVLRLPAPRSVSYSWHVRSFTSSPSGPSTLLCHPCHSGLSNSLNGSQCVRNTGWPPSPLRAKEFCCRVQRFIFSLSFLSPLIPEAKYTTQGTQHGTRDPNSVRFTVCRMCVSCPCVVFPVPPSLPNPCSRLEMHDYAQCWECIKPKRLQLQP